jgi:hypothetical protein
MKALFAVVGKWKLDPAQADTQRAVLTGRIIPGVQQAPGFVAGYWSKPTATGDAHTFIVFDDVTAAEAFAETVRRNRHSREGHGVSSDELSVVELMASAQPI